MADITGTPGNDALNGTTEDDVIHGLAGNDRLDGGAGDDILVGGVGNDTFIVGSPGDVVTELASQGADTVESSDSHTLGANVENLTLTGDLDVSGTGNTSANVILGNAGANTLVGFAGNDILRGGDGNDVLIGGAGNDRLEGGDGDDTYVVETASDIVYEAVSILGGVDKVIASFTFRLAIGQPIENLVLVGFSAINGTGNELANELAGNDGANILAGLAGNDLLTGYDGNDTLIGGDGNDVLRGGFGNDRLDGGAGDDELAGGWGDDTYVVGLGSDLVHEGIDEGFDTVQSALVGFTLGDNVENLVLIASGTAVLSVNGFGNALDNVVTGNALANLLEGNDGSDTLFGLAGNDTLAGGAGDDRLDGGAGNDEMVGGQGNDTYVVGSALDALTELALEGTDTVESSISFALGLELENLVLTGKAATSGTGNELDNFITGNAAANTLSGGLGNDTLNGGAGKDTLRGGQGDDTYVMSSGDAIVELADEGTDEVQSSITYTLGANVENLTLTGSAVVNGTGNALDNVIQGNDKNNTLAGAVGNDTLRGAGGNDRLDGGAGDDILEGGDGDDTYVLSPGTDSLVEAEEQGIDTVEASVTYTLGENFENLVLTGALAISGIGNALDNAITGNAAANILEGGEGNDALNGGAGIDTLIGGLGDDTFVFGAGDTYVEDADGGIDTLMSSVSITLVANVENLTLTGKAAISGTGNELDNLIIGNSGANTLNGGLGNDTLNGGAGKDTLRGGQGDDTYVMTSGDVIIELAGEGTDEVQSSITVTLAANVENLTLTGEAAVTGTGNALDNVIQGNDKNNTLAGAVGNDTLRGAGGNDRLDGGAGDDTLEGGEGDDTYVLSPGADTLTEAEEQGIDTVEAFFTYVLGENFENLVLIGAAAISGTGNDADNQITGNSAANTLEGGEGNDTLNGGAGLDTLIGGLGDDTFIFGTGDTYVENVNGGNDTLTSSVSTMLVANVENLTLMGKAAIAGTGNELDNVITGNAAANTLNGGVGNDTLNGGAGKDTLRGGQGDDLYVMTAGDVIIELAGEGTDEVRSSIAVTLAANVENLTLTGEAAANGTGNALDNVIQGNEENNILAGAAGNDTLRGAGGDDRLDGGAGDDTLEGGDGDDTYVVSAGADTLIEAEEQGIDTVDASVTCTLGDNFEILVLTGVLAISGTGNVLDNVITGNAAANTLDGGEGNDTLNGGAGLDTLIGGLGDDTFIFGAGDTYVEDVDGGNDTLMSSVSTMLVIANVENLKLTGTAAITGTGNELDNVITGNDAANTLTGGTGNDTLNGLGGLDRLLGGQGDDIYVMTLGDEIVELADEGIDEVRSSISVTLAANVENLVLTGMVAANGTGNALANVIEGNSGVNALTGGAGNDTLRGGDGDDRLDGGLGDDTLEGGAGNDTYFVASGLDVLIENAGEGADLVQSAIGFVLGENFENLTLTGILAINGEGNGLNNILRGNASSNVLAGGEGDDTLKGAAGDDILDGGGGNDLLDGEAGLDTLMGGLGDDTFVFSAGDTIVEDATGGIDTVMSSTSTTLVFANVENLTLTGTAAISGTGNELDNAITGNEAANTLTGGAGNDILNGMGGADRLEGGAGNDTYVWTPGDDIVELADEGTDTVESEVSYTLAENFENLTLAGFNAINGTGNDAANVLAGNFSPNILTGGAGDDAFVFNWTPDGWYDVDTITDFVGGSDKVHLNLGVFTSLGSTGTLDSSRFNLGTEAMDADDFILYDSDTGALYYDADGSGVDWGATQFAILEGQPVLAATDFMVI